MIVFGFGSMAGGPILGFINDKLGGQKAASKGSVILLIIIYGSLYLCNEI